jgi:hypothetical protein
MQYSRYLGVVARVTTIRHAPVKYTQTDWFSFLFRLGFFPPPVVIIGTSLVCLPCHSLPFIYHHKVFFFTAQLVVTYSAYIAAVCGVALWRHIPCLYQPPPCCVRAFHQLARDVTYIDLADRFETPFDGGHLLGRPFPPHRPLATFD